MKRILSPLLDSLFLLALALWLGGQGTYLLFMLSGDANHAPRLFVHRFQSLVEVSGLIMAGILFLLRRRYQRSRPLFLTDGLRQLLTFAALMLAEYNKYGLQSGQAGASGYVLTGSDLILTATQIVLLLVVTILTVRLQQPQGVTATPASAASPPSAPKPARAATRKPAR